MTSKFKKCFAETVLWKVNNLETQQQGTGLTYQLVKGASYPIKRRFLVLLKAILQDPKSKSVHGTGSISSPTGNFSTGNPTSTVVTTTGNPVHSIEDLNINRKRDPKSQHRDDSTSFNSNPYLKINYPKHKRPHLWTVLAEGLILKWIYLFKAQGRLQQVKSTAGFSLLAEFVPDSLRTCRSTCRKSWCREIHV